MARNSDLGGKTNKLIQNQRELELRKQRLANPHLDPEERARLKNIGPKAHNKEVRHLDPVKREGFGVGSGGIKNDPSMTGLSDKEIATELSKMLEKERMIDNGSTNGRKRK